MSARCRVRAVELTPLAPCADAAASQRPQSGLAINRRMAEAKHKKVQKKQKAAFHMALREEKERQREMTKGIAGARRARPVAMVEAGSVVAEVAAGREEKKQQAVAWAAREKEAERKHVPLVCGAADDGAAGEWWDAALEQAGGGLNTEVLSLFVQHPVPVAGPKRGPPPAPRALHLTEKERKKIRRRERKTAQDETNLKIKLGLMDAPPPKVKMSNMARVYGEEAVLNPTKVEEEVRRQVEERQRKHLEHNASHKLTKEERSDKNWKKHEEDLSVEVTTCVFRVRDLDDNRHRFKVNKGAADNHLHGVALLHAGASIVVVEGGPRGVRKFKRLMMHRIDWNQKWEAEEELEEGKDDPNDPRRGARGRERVVPEGENECELVCEIVRSERAFHNFFFRAASGEASMLRFFTQKGVPEFFHVARTFVKSTP